MHKILNNDNRATYASREPLTGAPGVQGTGIGAIVAGAAARAAAGTVAAAPVGTVVGPAVDPTHERAYWSENFSGCDYVEKGSSFDDYGPAYDFGVDARGQYPGREFDDVEPEMSRDWAASRGASSLSWERAKHAARDAWNRISPSS